MYFFYPNRTLICDEELTHLFASLMILVIILTIFGMILIILESCLRISFKSISIGYHLNLSIIFMNLAIFYLIFSPSIIVVIIQIFDWNNPENLESTAIFHYANIFRSFYIYVGAFTLPAIAIERMFATVFVEDYEIKRRPYIGISLTLIVNGFSMIAMVCFIYDLCSIFLILTIIAMLNIVALILFLYYSKYNLSFYEDNFCHGSCKRYSLSQRFQVVENIKAASMIKKMFICGWLSTISLVCLFALSFLLGKSAFSSIIFIFFDLTIAIYAIAIQAINIFENQTLQNEYKKMIKKWNLPFISCKIEPSGKRIRSVFGVEVIGEAAEETQKHFNQLKKTWKC